MRRWLLAFVVFAVGSRAYGDDGERLAALEVQIAELTVVSESQSEAIDELSAAVSELARKRAEGQDSEVIALELDRISAEIARLEADVVEAPVEAPSEGYAAQNSWLDGQFYDAQIAGPLYAGMSLAGNFSLSVPERFDEIESVGFRLRRARLRLHGSVSERIWAFANLDLSRQQPILDAFADISLLAPTAADAQKAFATTLRLRVGQFQVPYLRNSMIFAENLGFFLRPQVFEALRYERDLGAEILGTWKRLDYQIGVTNGAGANQFFSANENLDFLAFARASVAVAGNPSPYTVGDFAGTKKLRFRLGAGATHDLVRLPFRIAGIDLGSRDVNQDGDVDNVRVVSTSFDVLMRYGGWELAAEAAYRYERWGSILFNTTNQSIRNLVGPDEKGQRSYVSVSSHVLGFVIPKTLLVGARFHYGQLSLLPVGGRTIVAALPEDDDVFNFEGLIQLYQSNSQSAPRRRLGLLYRATYLPAPRGQGDHVSHQIMLEGQIELPN